MEGMGTGCGGREPLAASTMCEYERECFPSLLRGSAVVARGFNAALGADGSAKDSEMGSGDERGAYPSAETAYEVILVDGSTGADGCEAGSSTRGGEGVCRNAAGPAVVVEVGAAAAVTAW